MWYMAVTYGGYRWEKQTEEHLKDPVFLESYGYKVFSQNDEDGILQEIFERVGTETKRFVEFGVQNGLECNSHYLLYKGWNGLWLEGYRPFYEEIQEKFAGVLQSGALRTDCAFITRENINELLEKNGMTGEIDLLSIDVDGNDYHIWKAVSVVRPRVVCIEYNGKFPPDCEWIMPYFHAHQWQGNDNHSASLKSLEKLGRRLGYQLVGTNMTGVNAFFVRQELAGERFPLPATAENLYNAPKYQQEHVAGHPSQFCLLGESIVSRRNNWLPQMSCNNGATRQGEPIECLPGGVIFGPYTTLPAGECRLAVTVKLPEGLKETEGQLTCDCGRQVLQKGVLKDGSNVLLLNLEEQRENVEFVMYNTAKAAIWLEEIYLY